MAMITKSKKHQTANKSIIVAIIGLLMIFLPMNLGLDGMDGGFAVAILGGMVFSTGIIIFVIYKRHAKEEDSLLAGDNLLVHWKYTPEQWQVYAETDFAEDKASKKFLFWLITAFALFFGILFTLLDPENGIYVLFVMLALIAIIGTVATLTSKSSYKRNKSKVGEVYLSERSVLINGELHVWGMLNSRLKNVKVVEYENLTLLSIEYSVQQRGAEAIYTARIPVPYGNENHVDELADIIRNYKKQKNKG